jgi:MFS family permease
VQLEHGPESASEAGIADQDYSRTLTASNLAGFIQSATMNLSPFLFVSLMALYGLSYTELGFLVLVNFLAQFAACVYFGWPVNKYGYKPFCVGSQVVIVVGLSLFAGAPWIAPGNEMVVLAIGTVIFSIGTGLLEVLLSPITKSIPADNSEANFMIMHSAFAGGIFAAALVTTLLLRVLGDQRWQLIVLLWALLPLYNTFRFVKSPMPDIIPEEKRMKVGSLLRSPVFIVAFFAIPGGHGASHRPVGLDLPRRRLVCRRRRRRPRPLLVSAMLAAAACSMRNGAPGST